MKKYQFLKDHFVSIFSKKAEFPTEEVMALIAPHYDFNEQKAFDEGLRREALNLIKSAKDQDGLRDCIAYNKAQKGEPEQLVFSFISECQNDDILHRQDARLLKMELGIKNQRKKIEYQLFMNKYGMSLQEFIPSKKEEFFQ